MSDKSVHVGLVSGQVGAIGQNPSASGNVFQQQSVQSQEDIPLATLSEELDRLKQELEKVASVSDHKFAIGSVDAAIVEAKAGNGPKAIEFLKHAGTWALEVAQKIGVAVAVKAIESAIGIKK